MNQEEIKETARDAFREMGNIGAGSAVTVLSNIIGKSVTEMLPNVMRLEYDRLINTFGVENEKVLGLLFPVHGEISGLLLFVLKKGFISEIFEHLTGEKAELGGLSETKMSFLKEIADIMASAYFTALSSYTKKKVEISVPAVSADMAGALVADTAGWAAQKGPGSVCIETGFAGTDPKEACHLCFMMYQESTYGFLKSLGVDI